LASLLLRQFIKKSIGKVSKIFLEL